MSETPKDFQKRITEQMAEEVAKARQEGIADTFRALKNYEQMQTRIERLEAAVRYLSLHSDSPFGIGFLVNHHANVEAILRGERTEAPPENPAVKSAVADV